MANNREWHRGAELPALAVWWLDSQGTLIDFTGAAFEVRIGQLGCPALLVKTSGVTGGAGAGAEPTGTPNVLITWQPDDLDIEPDAYIVTIVATVGASDRVMQTTLRILDVVEDPSS